MSGFWADVALPDIPCWGRVYCPLSSSQHGYSSNLLLILYVQLATWGPASVDGLYLVPEGSTLLSVFQCHLECFFFFLGPHGLSSLCSVHCLILYVCSCISVKRKLSAKGSWGPKCIPGGSLLDCSLCVCTNGLPFQFAITCQTGKHSLLVCKLAMTWLSMGHGATHTVFSDYIQWICQKDTEKQHALPSAHTYGMQSIKLNINSRQLNIQYF